MWSVSINVLPCCINIMHQSVASFFSHNKSLLLKWQWVKYHTVRQWLSECNLFTPDSIVCSLPSSDCIEQWSFTGSPLNAPVSLSIESPPPALGPLMLRKWTKETCGHDPASELTLNSCKEWQAETSPPNWIWWRLIKRPQAERLYWSGHVFHLEHRNKGIHNGVILRCRGTFLGDLCSLSVVFLFLLNYNSTVNVFPKWLKNN